MHRSAEDEVRHAKADGRWNAAYAGQATAEVPEDLAKAPIADPVRRMFQVLSSANLYSILYRIGLVKVEHLKESNGVDECRVLNRRTEEPLTCSRRERPAAPPQDLVVGE
jgi:hypothetical protein